MQLLSNPALLWFLAGLAMLIAELFAPSLILVFFGIGAWIVTALYLLFGINLPAQLLIFVASSLLLLALLRRKLKPVFLGYVTSRQESGKNIEDIFGREAVVVSPIEPGRPGRVEFNGVAWEAESEACLETDARVKILDRNGLRLKVAPLHPAAAAADGSNQ
jgi:membrane protein implicated in regulation of membrane protease activity